jgi:hypothetical protein
MTSVPLIPAVTTHVLLSPPLPSAELIRRVTLLRLNQGDKAAIQGTQKGDGNVTHRALQQRNEFDLLPLRKTV